MDPHCNTAKRGFRTVDLRRPSPDEARNGFIRTALGLALYVGTTRTGHGPS